MVYSTVNQEKKSVHGDIIHTPFFMAQNCIMYDIVKWVSRLRGCGTVLDLTWMECVVDDEVIHALNLTPM